MSHCMNLEFATFNWQSPVCNIEFFAIIFSHSFLEELQPDRSFPKLIVLEKVMEQLFEYLFLNLEGLKHDRLNF